MNLRSVNVIEYETQEEPPVVRSAPKMGPRPVKYGRLYGKQPRQHNGIHRRRRKKMRW